MKICIDPGHGGDDPGAIGHYDDKPYYEKDINLTASHMLAGVLNSFGHEAIMIRVADETMSLDCRSGEANDSDCDLFISVHCNSFGSSVPRGFGVYHYPNSDKGEEVAAEILGKVVLIPWLCQHGDGVEGKNFHVLRETKMPAVLVELSFMSNVDDLLNLLTLPNLFLLMRLIGQAIHESQSE